MMSMRSTKLKKVDFCKPRVDHKKIKKSPFFSPRSTPRRAKRDLFQAFHGTLPKFPVVISDL